MRTCPACGAVRDDRPFADVRMTDRARRLLSLVEARPGISSVELAGLIYAEDPDGGPDDFAQAIRNFVRQVNRKIRPRGWTVNSPPGPGAGYMLRPFPSR